MNRIPELPKEIYGEIAQHVPREKQAQERFHKVNRAFSQMPIPYETCCQEPSTNEIATWLYNQGQILANSNIKSNPLIPKGETFTFYFTDNKRIKMFSNGKLYGGDSRHEYDPKAVELLSRNSMLKFIGTSKFKNESTTNDLNWIMIRNILSKRKNCFLHGKSSDDCFIQMLNEKLYKHLSNIPSYYFDSLYRLEGMHMNLSDIEILLMLIKSNLNSVLNKDAQQRFEHDFRQRYNTLYNIHSIFESELLDVIQWSKDWVANLKPVDLWR